MTKTHHRETKFRFFRPGARQVFLVGDFNNWDKAALPLNREPNGDWCGRLSLPEGVYQFRYYADGEWYTDYAAFGIEYTPLGCNSVLVVSDSHWCGDDSSDTDVCGTGPVVLTDCSSTEPPSGYGRAGRSNRGRCRPEPQPRPFA